MEDIYWNKFKKKVCLVGSYYANYFHFHISTYLQFGKYFSMSFEHETFWTIELSSTWSKSSSELAGN